MEHEKELFDPVSRKFPDLLLLHNLISNLFLMIYPVSVPIRQGGVNYVEQTKLFNETNQAMVALLRETQQENQKFLGQLLLQ